MPDSHATTADAVAAHALQHHFADLCPAMRFERVALHAEHQPHIVAMPPCASRESQRIGQATGAEGRQPSSHVEVAGQLADLVAARGRRLLDLPAAGFAAASSSASSENSTASPSKAMRTSCGCVLEACAACG